MKTLGFMDSLILSPIDDVADAEPTNLVYCGIGCEEGKIVPVAEAFEYALQQCGIALLPHSEKAPDYADFCEMLVDWYFSGNRMLRSQP